MQKTLSRLLRHVADELESGNSTMSHDEMVNLTIIMREMASDDAKLRSADQVCRQLGICRKTLYNWVRDGLFPEGKKISGVNADFWRQDAIDAAINELKDKGCYR